MPLRQPTPRPRQRSSDNPHHDERPPLTARDRLPTRRARPAEPASLLRRCARLARPARERRSPTHPDRPCATPRVRHARLRARARVRRRAVVIAVRAASRRRRRPSAPSPHPESSHAAEVIVAGRHGAPLAALAMLATPLRRLTPPRPAPTPRAASPRTSRARSGHRSNRRDAAASRWIVAPDAPRRRTLGDGTPASAPGGERTSAFTGEPTGHPLRAARGRHAAPGERPRARGGGTSSTSSTSRTAPCARPGTRWSSRRRAAGARRSTRRA
jgi:hypothetical protein